MSVCMHLDSIPNVGDALAKGHAAVQTQLWIHADWLKRLSKLGLAAISCETS